MKQVTLFNYDNHKLITEGFISDTPRLWKDLVITDESGNVKWEDKFTLIFISDVSNQHVIAIHLKNNHGDEYILTYA